MAKPFQFSFLLDLAADKRDAAATALSEAVQRLMQSRDRLAQIEQYRAEYRLRFSNSAGQGMPAHQWQDFHAFLTKLDGAVEQQARDIQRCEGVVEQRRLAWLETEKEVKAYETLQTRHVQRENHREAKREQKLTDDWVSNAAHRREPTGH
ncbi:flagellar export protein FliJ [Chitinimonas sp. BJYL2]|uniref:flagellar export protein FliJ n=1 Tax=Chitinimonas sp. BJYL2 TaxID=2976696 RepID=UPI0022B4011D|nr:flagellar export protein FliJ [Chitinimonas sp. BJYL2]